MFTPNIHGDVDKDIFTPRLLRVCSYFYSMLSFIDIFIVDSLDLFMLLLTEIKSVNYMLN